MRTCLFRGYNYWPVTLYQWVNQQISLKQGAGLVWLAAARRMRPGLTEADCGGATTRSVLLHKFKLKLTWSECLLREKEVRICITFIRGQ